MSMDLENWLAVEQVMEEENQVLLQQDSPESEAAQTPQLLMISLHATQGTSSTATFSLIVIIGGKKGIALVDSGSTDTFIDYTFASKTHCSIISTKAKRVKVASGGYLDSNAITAQTTYFIQVEAFTNEFKLLQLKGHDIILGCDLIQRHSPIGLDPRAESRELSVHKDGKDRVVFQDFTNPTKRSIISAAQLQKLCRSEVLGYVVQINLLQEVPEAPTAVLVHPDIAAIL
jgi:hypothetical protein